MPEDEIIYDYPDLTREAILRRKSDAIRSFVEDADQIVLELIE